MHPPRPYLIADVSNKVRPCPSCHDRQRRDLQRRSLPAEPKAPPPQPRDSGAYVPALADRVERDQRLSDGARRCARVIAAYVHRRQREARAGAVTVTWIARAMGRSRRTVQRYLRQLEAAGYIEVLVIPSRHTRMCVGLLVRLCAPLLPRHGWPDAMKPGATGLAQINRSERHKRPIPIKDWRARCWDGMVRRLIALAGPPPDVLRL